jgi:hypothetical protein
MSGKKKALIPWAKLTVDPTAWIDKECYPPGFKWADPSKIRINDVFQLFDHWRHRKQSGLAPIIWNSSCDILTDVERPIQRIRNRRPVHSNHNPDPRRNSSESEDFGPAIAGISESHLEPQRSPSPPPPPIPSQRIASAPVSLRLEEDIPDQDRSCQSFIYFIYFILNQVAYSIII